MSTRSPAAKSARTATATTKSARSRAAPAPARAKAASAKPAVAAKPKPTGDLAALGELAARLAKIELAGLAGKLLQGWRADLDAVVNANKRAYAGLQAIVSRQAAQIGEAVAEVQSVGKVMSAVGAKESVRNLDDLALASLDLALADMRELAELAAKAQREAFEIVHERVTANIDEVQRLLHK